MIGFKEAIDIILKNIVLLPSEVRKIKDTLGFILAEDVFAKQDVPDFDNSAMDGYAVFAQDTDMASMENPVSLEIIDEIPAGKVPRKKISYGRASKIMTGAMIPKGADAVVIVENTERDGNFVKVKTRVVKGENIRKRGESVNKGELVLKKGDIIRPQEMGILVDLGKPSVKVVRKPIVGILSTGNEIVTSIEKMKAGKVMDSNRYSLIGLILEAGGLPLDLGLVRDRMDKLIKKLVDCVKRCDVVITSGGVSMGERDFVKNVFSKIGYINFWKVAIKPGKPVVFGRIKNKPFFGLPGNPVSCMVTFEQFVRPALLKMMGRKDIFRKKYVAISEAKMTKRAGVREFIRAKIDYRDNKCYVKPTGPQGSGILRSMVLADGYIILPENIKDVEIGEEVEIELFGS